MRATPEDMRRDVAADLALCEAARTGPYTVRWHPGGLDIEPLAGALDEPAWEMMVASREGWPAAIRRTLDAEDLLRRIVACGHCAHDVFAVQEEAKAHLMGRGG
jgi:hypothetical protein